MGPSGKPSRPPSAGAGFPRGPTPPPSAAEADFALQLAYTAACSAIAGCNSTPGIAGPLSWNIADGETFAGHESCLLYTSDAADDM
eukprot:12861159-Alexandrium_andersonii.AAC.1